MALSLDAYHALEALAGRSRLWRLGRWLYLGSRRELRNDPEINGEYGLLDWSAKAFNALKGRERLIVCDVGANVGNWAARASSSLRSAGWDDFVIHCCEPAPSQLTALSRLLAKDIAEGRVIADSRGVAAEAGAVAFTITGEATGNSAISASGEAAAGAHVIQVTTLDALCREAGYPRLDLVKVDTEGNDFNVIAGAEALFDAERIGILQFEYNWRWVAFRRWLKDVFDFAEGRPYSVGRLTREGVEFYSDWHPELDRFIETNYVLVRDDLVDLLPHWFAAFDASNIAGKRPRPDKA